MDTFSFFASISLGDHLALEFEHNLLDKEYN